MRKAIIPFILLLHTFFIQSGYAQNVQPFHDNDRVVFLGNSITDGGHYHSYIWLFYMTRFPDRRVDIFNAGIGGDKVSDMHARFDTDVLTSKPTYLILTFGMNDTGYDAYNGENSAEYAKTQVEITHKAYKQIEQRIKEFPRWRVALMGSSPYDEYVQLETKPLKGKNDAMLEVVKFQQDAAKTNGWGFTDLNRPMTEINRQKQTADPEFTLCGGDRIHPDNDGHMVMTYFFLRGQGFSGSKVADVEIDITKKRIIKSGNCNISELKTEDGILSFHYLAKSLPYPVDTIPRNWGTTQAKGLENVPFAEEMNQELFRINGLKGKYRLTIDGQPIGEWTAGEFEKGIDLAQYSSTPQYQQAMSVMYLNEERWEIERRIRQYKAMEYIFLKSKDLLFADNRQALDAINKERDKNYLLKIIYPTYTKAMFPQIRNTWQKQMEVILSEIYKINKPIVRKIGIIKIKE